MLRSEHGHIFHFECYIPVTEGRQLEFLKVRRELIGAVLQSYGEYRAKEPCDFRGMSCEELAQSLHRLIRNYYGVSARVIVMEDTFVGAEVKVCITPSVRYLR